MEIKSGEEVVRVKDLQKLALITRLPQPKTGFVGIDAEEDIFKIPTFTIPPRLEEKPDYVIHDRVLGTEVRRVGINPLHDFVSTEIPAKFAGKKVRITISECKDEG